MLGTIDFGRKEKMWLEPNISFVKDNNFTIYNWKMYSLKPGRDNKGDN